MKIKDLKNMVNQYRNKAIIMFRLNETNRLIERLQEAKSNLKKIVETIARTNAGIERVTDDAWSPSLSQAKAGETVEELKAQALKNLKEAKDELEKSAIQAQEEVSKIESEIEKLANGSRKFSREQISAAAEELIQRDALNFNFPETAENE